MAYCHIHLYKRKAERLEARMTYINGSASFYKPYSYTLEKQHILCQLPIRRINIHLKKKKKWLASITNARVANTFAVGNMTNTLNILTSTSNI